MDERLVEVEVRVGDLTVAPREAAVATTSWIHLRTLFAPARPNSTENGSIDADRRVLDAVDRGADRLVDDRGVDEPAVHRLQIGSRLLALVVDEKLEVASGIGLTLRLAHAVALAYRDP